MKRDPRQRMRLVGRVRITIRRRPDDVYDAFIGRNHVGWAQVDIQRTDGTADVRRVFRAHVKADFRRMGVATRIYDEIEKDLSKADLTLVPAKPGLLSDDSFAFWLKRNPALLKEDPRLARP